MRWLLRFRRRIGAGVSTVVLPTLDWNWPCVGRYHAACRWKASSLLPHLRDDLEHDE